jgi:hypothetical protein
MTSPESRTARQASIGSGSRLGHRVTAVLCWLIALLIAGPILLGEPDWPWWVRLPVGVVVLLAMAVLGLMIWSGAEDRIADTRRLREAGRPATAEILALELEQHHDGSDDMALLTLRISGEGVPAFEATYRCTNEPALRVGAQLDATVDPTDNLFTLRQL